MSLFTSKRRATRFKEAMLAIAIAGVLLGCQRQAETSLPVGNYVDLRKGACRLMVVRDSGLKSIDATACDSGVSKGVITMQVPNCGIVTFTSSTGMPTAQTYARHPKLAPCQLDQHDKQNLSWVVLS